MIDRRQRNGRWNVLDAKGNYYSNYEGAQLAVLMDIRERLDHLEVLGLRILSLDRIVRTISKKIPKPKAR